MREAISMQSEAPIGGASSHAIERLDLSVAAPSAIRGNQHQISVQSSGWTFQLQPRPLQQHLADIEVAGGSGEMQRRLPRVRPSMHVNERT
jgi:hypothetical protein